MNKELLKYAIECAKIRDEEFSKDNLIDLNESDDE